MHSHIDKKWQCFGKVREKRGWHGNAWSIEQREIWEKCKTI